MPGFMSISRVHGQIQSALGTVTGMPAARMICAGALNLGVLADRKRHAGGAIGSVFPRNPSDDAGALQSAALAVVEEKSRVPFLPAVGQERITSVHCAVVENGGADIALNRLGVREPN